MNATRASGHRQLCFSCRVFILIPALAWLNLEAAVVTTCDEAGLRAALAGGGTVTFACDGTIVLANTVAITNNVVLDGSGRSVIISVPGWVIFKNCPGTALQETEMHRWPLPESSCNVESNCYLLPVLFLAP